MSLFKIIYNNSEEYNWKDIKKPGHIFYKARLSFIEKKFLLFLKNLIHFLHPLISEIACIARFVDRGPYPLHCFISCLIGHLFNGALFFYNLFLLLLGATGESYTE